MFTQTEKCIYLVRQYFAYNLYDRYHVHPFLTVTEKKWFSFQLLCALKQLHQDGIRHGDLKSENIVLTTYNWLFVTDIGKNQQTFNYFDKFGERLY
jgi:phosphoinositide-3-kinase regulatory subunit 4